MSKQSDNEILNILKIDEKILKNINGLSFRDKRIEEEYLNYYMKLNIMLKYFIYFCYLLNHAYKLIQRNFKNILWIFIVQFIFSLTHFVIVLGFFLQKTPSIKNFLTYLLL